MNVAWPFVAPLNDRESSGLDSPVSTLADVKDVPFRIAGSSGGWHLMFGQWAELGEELLSFNLYICHQCGRVQLFADVEAQKIPTFRLSSDQFCNSCRPGQC